MARALDGAGHSMMSASAELRIESDSPWCIRANDWTITWLARERVVDRDAAPDRTSKQEQCR
jgi:hypothetical protein